MYLLALRMLGKFSGRYSLFFPEIRFRIFYANCQSPFSGKNKKISPVCRLLILPREWQRLICAPSENKGSYQEVQSSLGTERRKDDALTKTR